MGGKPGTYGKSPEEWMGEQEDRVDALKERIDRKQRELVRLAEVEGEDLVPDKGHPNLDTAIRFNPGLDNISQIEERRLSEGFQREEGEMLWKRPSSSRTQEQADGQVRTLTPAEGGVPDEEDRESQVGLNFLRYSVLEEGVLEERQRLREKASRGQDG